MNQADDKDREQILAHINCIFSAFIRQDREILRKTHTVDWIGFMIPSTEIERGVDAYMANAENSLKNFKGTGYELLDHEIQILGDVAIVYYVARYDYKDQDNQEHSFPLRSIDIYRRDSGGWIQAGSHITVIPSGDA